MSPRRRFIKVATALLLAAALNLSACGYILYPERKGLDAGKLDMAVVILDAAGLVIGIVPGVIAFAVDISTGAIYLPGGDKSIINKHLKTGEMHPKEAPEIDKTALASRLSRGLHQPIAPETIQFYEASPADSTPWEPMEATVLN